MDGFQQTAANHPPLTPIGFIERAATVYGDCTSIIYGDTRYTWTQTFARCRRLASALHNRGISVGDVVSVVAPNVPAIYEAHFGVPMAGAVLNCVNTRLDARAMAAQFGHCRPKLVLADHQLLDVVADALRRVEHAVTLVVISDDAEHPEHPESRPTYESLLAGGHDGFEIEWPATEWQAIALNYTSGTTSAPKGVVHSHRGAHSMAVDSLLFWGLTPAQAERPVYLWTLPMFHANGWCFTWALAAVAAVNVCLRRFDASSVHAAIARHRVTHLCGAPVVLAMLADVPPEERPRQPQPVQVLTAGSPPPPAVLAKMEAAGFSVTHGYGMTETAGLVLSCAWKRRWDALPSEERARLKARQGVRVLGLTEVDVKDPATLASVPRDGRTRGELMLRGGSVMMGYLHDAEATARAFAGGWLRTGDVAVMHADGYAEIKDRAKDVIISGGENINSVEVETVLYSHPAVAEAAVVARPDPLWGETPCAFVVVSAAASAGGQVSEKDVAAFCRQRLPGFMVPKTVVFVGSLPKTSTGKIQKFMLRDVARSLGANSSPSVSVSRL